MTKVLCAWCLKGGKSEAEALIGEKQPVSDKTVSHGLCPEHRAEVEEEIAEHRRRMQKLQEKVDP